MSPCPQSVHVTVFMLQCHTILQLKHSTVSTNIGLLHDTVLVAAIKAFAYGSGMHMFPVPMSIYIRIQMYIPMKPDIIIYTPNGVNVCVSYACECRTHT